MDFDDLFSSKPDDPIVAMAKQDLGPLSLDALKAEIERVERHRDEAARHRAAADDIFKR